MPCARRRPLLVLLSDMLASSDMQRVVIDEDSAEKLELLKPDHTIS